MKQECHNTLCRQRRREWGRTCPACSVHIYSLHPLVAIQIHHLRHDRVRVVQPGSRGRHFGVRPRSLANEAACSACILSTVKQPWRRQYTPRCATLLWAHAGSNVLRDTRSLTLHSGNDSQCVQ